MKYKILPDTMNIKHIRLYFDKVSDDFNIDSFFISFYYVSLGPNYSIANPWINSIISE